MALDEPLYREWLIQRGDSVARPYREALIQGVPPSSSVLGKESETDGLPPTDINQDAKVWERELLSCSERIRQAALAWIEDGNTINDSDDNNQKVIFCKHMAKHSFLYNFENEVTLYDDKDSNENDKKKSSLSCRLIHKHVLLIRDPVAVLSSWGVADSVHGSSVTPDEVGIVPLLSIYSALLSRPSTSNLQSTTHLTPLVVVDSDELAMDPAGVLFDLCHQLGIPYLDAMITWSSGKHACDGPWAAWWYQDVHKSTGWKLQPFASNLDYGMTHNHRYRSLHPSLLPALRSSWPAYQFLITLTRGYQNRGPPASQIYEDSRNQELLVYIGAKGQKGGCIIPREMARVSPWDSSVQGGDAAWEGLRVYRGKILSLDKHLRRLQRSAKALGFENVHSSDEITHALFQVLAANGMRDGAHVRLTLTRGEKCTSSMNPKFNVYGTTLIIVPEWKPTDGGATTYDNTKGIVLITASQRRNSPQTVDSKIHHNNLINNILPKIQANLAGAADAIMLDLEGYVSETNATNIFMVDDEGVLLTPHADHCLPGITRATVLELARELNIPTQVRRISLAEFHAAEEVFTTGTMGALTPVCMIDGRIIGNGTRGPITTRLQEVYSTLPERSGWATELPPFETAAPSE
jgi:protein-lysine N-methyltransferase EEF2KMT